MKRYVLVAAVTGFAPHFPGFRPAAAQPQTQRPVSPVPARSRQQKAFIDQYCVTCHNQRTKTAGLGARYSGSHEAASERRNLGKGDHEDARPSHAAPERAAAGTRSSTVPDHVA